ncbi:hypothetical protein [Ovoidimarina sediminis]|uniref:hypothetical protein n=1 Tax=Ovoidimarina sediminis TaxID=3079856 RepID=UPI0029111E93|nr:hypothetical protein [Rhodophyticola sp. MJ-SS7]MDU8944603.1 hypothetical protein [Rhodophyticola sp. MJ-SS7]
MKKLLILLLLVPLSAYGQDADISRQLADNGLAATEDALSTIAEPSASDRFALGGVRFLRAIEQSLQTRWHHGLDTATLPIPVLRLPLPPNPDAVAAPADIIETLFADLAAGMDSARTALAPISDGDDVALRIDLNALWFDINANGTRDPGEDLAQAFFASMGAPTGAVGRMTLPTVRFDTADTAWLAAYTHLLSGVANLVQAFDTADAISRVRDGAATLATLRDETGQPHMDIGSIMIGAPEGTLDLVLTVYLALRTDPDPAHTRAARTHLLAMVAENRRFWARVATETDNDAEWIPNAAQTAALGFDLPPETSERWQAVLSDAEGLLTGRLLIPHWRFGPGIGVNLRRLLNDPIPVHLVEWIHGLDLLPYTETGEPVSDTNWRAFAAMASGNAGLYVLILN